MTLLSLGWAAEYADSDIAFTCLWPETYIATSAVANAPGFSEMLDRSRSPQIMGDAAVEILSRPVSEVNAQCFIDADLLASAGITDFSGYGGGNDPILDIFVDKP
jgi:hypothetical protein